MSSNYGAVQRLNWHNLPNINYYGKQNRGKKRKHGQLGDAAGSATKYDRTDVSTYHDPSEEADTRSRSSINGYEYVEDNPLVKVANSVLHNDSYMHPSPVKKVNPASFKSLGIQAGSPEDDEMQQIEEYRHEVKPQKQVKKKLKRIVLRRVNDQNNDARYRDNACATLDVRNGINNIALKNKNHNTDLGRHNRSNSTLEASYRNIRAQNILGSPTRSNGNFFLIVSFFSETD